MRSAHSRKSRQRSRLSVVANLVECGKKKNDASGNDSNGQRDVSISNSQVGMNSVKCRDQDRAEDSKKKNDRKTQQRADESQKQYAERNSIPMRGARCGDHKTLPNTSPTALVENRELEAGVGRKQLRNLPQAFGER